jgi:uncharacterized membrane protein
MSHPPERVPYGHSAERIGFFTDAVFAIAMTLLVIEIPRPEAKDLETGDGVSKSLAFTRLARFLWAQHSAYYAYLLAFLILWILWREHHTLADQITRMSGAMIGWHFPLLVLAAFLPYATTVLGHYPDNPMAALLLGVVAGLLFVCRSAIQQRADRDGVLRSDVNLAEYRRETTVSWIATGYWIAVLGLVWLTPWGQIPWFLTGVTANVADLVLRGRARRAEAAASEPDAPPPDQPSGDEPPVAEPGDAPAGDS